MIRQVMEALHVSLGTHAITFEIVSLNNLIGQLFNNSSLG